MRRKGATGSVCLQVCRSPLHRIRLSSEGGAEFCARGRRLAWFGAMAVTNWMLVVVAFFAFVAVSAVGHDLLPSDFLEQKPGSLTSDLLELRPILQQDIIDRVNGDKKATWKAGRSRRFESHTVKDFKKLCGTIMSDVDAEDDDMVVVSRKGTSTVELPKNFDSREAWPKCTTIGNILDQGHCGSCWAFGAVESLSDRFCIHGFENVNLSENDLLSCCGFECGYGCDGGYPYRAWQYFKRTGVVSESCDPYFDTIGCGHPGCSPTYDTPVCRKTCIGDDLWAESKHYASSAYYVSSDPEELMLELYTNGPFEVSFNVFEDFAHYESGVYKHTTGGYMGGHAVKLIGWGVTEDGVDYWTIANSWNAEWGEEGYFRIVRGLNDCGIETGATAGIPYIRGEASAM